MPGVSVLWSLLVVALSLVALVLVAFGVRELSLAYRILSRDPDRVLDAPKGGPIELVGTVGPEGATLRSPFTDAECVAYEYEVTEKRTRTQTTGKSTTTQTYWETIASGREAVPFRLEDDTGEVLVDPAGADLQLDAEHTIRVEGGTEPPEVIARYIRDDERVDDQNRSLDHHQFELHTGNDRRFVERRLDVGEPVHVLGVARYAVVGAPVQAANRWDGLRARLVGPRFLVSDTTERGAGIRVALPGLAAVLVGAVVLALLVVFVL